jgi:hypothetical protein
MRGDHLQRRHEGDLLSWLTNGQHEVIKEIRSTKEQQGPASTDKQRMTSPIPAMPIGAARSSTEVETQ